MAQENSGFEHACTCIFTISKTGENSADFEIQAPIYHGAASVSGGGLIFCLNDIRSECLRLKTFTITGEKYAMVTIFFFFYSKQRLTLSEVVLTEGFLVTAKNGLGRRGKFVYNKRNLL